MRRSAGAKPDCGLWGARGDRLVRFADDADRLFRGATCGKSPSEGNNVSTQIAFGYTVDGYGVCDLVEIIREVTDTEGDELVQESRDLYTIPDRSNATMASIRTAARQEIGIRRFLEEGNYSGFTDTFEDLYGFDQLPGLAAQQLMADGYGFGAEGGLENRSVAPFAEGHGLRASRRREFHGGLHLPF